MAHRYQEPVEVWVDRTGLPTAFTWRGVTYGPFEVIGRWHLKDRWWEGTAIRERSDRQYYRVMQLDLQVLELYQDASGAWVLDVIQDWHTPTSAELPMAASFVHSLSPQ